LGTQWEHIGDKTNSPPSCDHHHPMNSRVTFPSLPSLGIMQGIYNIPLHLVDPRSKEKVGSLGSWHDPWIHPQSIDRV